MSPVAKEVRLCMEGFISFAWLAFVALFAVVLLQLSHWGEEP